MAVMNRLTYSFGAGKAEGHARMREILGGKGAGLHEMTRIGIPVPPGFTIPTSVCDYFYAHRRRYPKGLEKAVANSLKKIEKTLARRFGDPANPLLLSVRSGARESMPGMMDTVLNLGLNDRTVEGLAKHSRNRRFAYDSYRRFVQMYADVVMGVKSNDKDAVDPLTQILESKKARRGIRDDAELSADDLRELVSEYKRRDRIKTWQEVSRRSL